MPRASDNMTGRESGSGDLDWNASVASIDTCNTSCHTPLVPNTNSTPLLHHEDTSPLQPTIDTDPNNSDNILPPNDNTNCSLKLFDEAIVTERRCTIYAKTKDHCVYKFNPQPNLDEETCSCIAVNAIDAWQMLLFIEHSNISLDVPDKPEPPWWNHLRTLHEFAATDYESD